MKNDLAPRKVVQVHTLYVNASPMREPVIQTTAVADDGTIWVHSMTAQSGQDLGWSALPPLPQEEPRP